MRFRSQPATDTSMRRVHCGAWEPGGQRSGCRVLPLGDLYIHTYIPLLLFSTFDGWSFRPAHQLDSPFGHFLRLTNMSRRTRLCDRDGSHDQVLTKTPVEGLTDDTSSQSSVARRGLAGPPRPRTWRRRRTDFAAIAEPVWDTLNYGVFPGGTPLPKWRSAPDGLRGDGRSRRDL